MSTLELLSKSQNFANIAVNAIKKSISPYNFIEHTKQELKTANFIHVIILVS